MHEFSKAKTQANPFTHPFETIQTESENSLSVFESNWIMRMSRFPLREKNGIRCVECVTCIELTRFEMLRNALSSDKIFFPNVPLMRFNKIEP